MQWNLQDLFFNAFGLLLLVGSAMQWRTLIRRRDLLITPQGIDDDAAPKSTPLDDSASHSPAPPHAMDDDSAQTVRRVPGEVNTPSLFIAAAWIGLTLLLRIRTDLGMSPDLPPTLDAVQTSCLLNFALWAFMVWLLTDKGQRSLAEWGGRFPPANDDVELGSKTFLLILAPVYALLLATLPFRNEENQHEFLQLLRDDPTSATLIWLILAAVVLAPLSEELMFRVILQGWLRARWPRHVAIVFTALLFAAVHGWPDAIPLIPLALILGYVNDRYRNYTTIVLAHALFNGLNLALSLTGT
ncbi:MAG: type II CAAX endopeptidase family protein [Planctomycetota bacterium]|nr:type II CAAX endopeptidase family protein [Planctomycetota bacterium]MDA1214898.1 type II CAAX endopeptidase family protein [Planctomycetota bacterium]